MKSLLRRLCREQDGQVLYLVAASMIAILGMAALSIDIGFALHAQRELQANTDAAASAGGASMPNPNTPSVLAVVDNYSGESGALYNVHHDLNITNVSVTYACLSTTSYPNYNLPPCLESSNGSYPNCSVTSGTTTTTTGCNAIKVVETAIEPTFFAKIFGFNALTLTATSIASASGNAVPYHIMIVLDTTDSMRTTTDTGCMSTLTAAFTAEQCAQMGVQTLLGNLAPCIQGQTCSGSGTVTPVDQVGLMVFPGTCWETLVAGACPTPTSLTNTTQTPYASDDYTCSSNPPDPPPTPYNNDPAYLVLPFQDNYRSTDSSTTLNETSELAEAIGADTWVATNTTNNCGMPGYGGEGTFYGGIIVAAQTYLHENHTAHVQDIMIFLSDGDANATTNQLSGSVSQNQGSDGVSQTQIPAMNSNGTWAQAAQCTQAVQAATWAKGQADTAGDGLTTLIYSVSYGSEASGCTSGESVPGTGGNTPNTPCATMASIASTPLTKYFFSVPQSSGSGTQLCQGGDPLTKLDEVFQAISAQLESSRLIPGSLTSAATWTSAP